MVTNLTNSFYFAESLNSGRLAQRVPLSGNGPCNATFLRAHIFCSCTLTESLLKVTVSFKDGSPSFACYKKGAVKHSFIHFLSDKILLQNVESMILKTKKLLTDSLNAPSCSLTSDTKLSYSTAPPLIKLRIFLSWKRTQRYSEV